MSARAATILQLLSSAAAETGVRVLRADALSHRANVGGAGAPGEGPGDAARWARWGLETLRGRLVEISSAPGAAPLSLSLALVVQAQEQDEQPVWVAGRRTIFYPPDAAQVGVDLGALPVIWATTRGPGRPRRPRPRREGAPDAQRAARAASLLLRSGAFGLVVVDLPPGASLPQATLARLNKLAQHHDAAAVLLTVKPDHAPSLGSMVSLRVGSSTTPPDASGHTRVRLKALKDKRRAPGWTYEEVRRAPYGLR